MQLPLFCTLLFLTLTLPWAYSYATDPSFTRLQLYGPTLTDGNWTPHPMTLVGDYTWQINVTLDVRSPFILVNLMADNVTKQHTGVDV